MSCGDGGDVVSMKAKKCFSDLAEVKKGGQVFRVMFAPNTASVTIRRTKAGIRTKIKLLERY